MRTMLSALLLVACGHDERAPAARPVEAPRDGVHVVGALPGAPGWFVTATLTREPGRVVGCIHQGAADCAQPVEIALDRDDVAETYGLIHGLGGSMYRCVAGSAADGGVRFSLWIDGEERHAFFPPTERDVDAWARCEATNTTSTAWSVARWMLASARRPADLPRRVEARVRLPTSPTRIVSATIDLMAPELAIVGCAARADGPCEDLPRVTLSEHDRIELLVRLEGIRSEACRPDFPIAGTLIVDVGDSFEGLCSSDVALGWFIAHAIDPETASMQPLHWSGCG